MHWVAYAAAWDGECEVGMYVLAKSTVLARVTICEHVSKHVDENCNAENILRSLFDFQIFLCNKLAPKAWVSALQGGDCR